MVLMVALDSHCMWYKNMQLCLYTAPAPAVPGPLFTTFYKNLLGLFCLLLGAGLLVSQWTMNSIMIFIHVCCCYCILCYKDNNVWVCVKKMSPLSSVCLYLSAEGVNHRHPEVLCRVVAVNALGETAAYIHQAVQRHGCDVALTHGNVGAQQPAVCLRVITLYLRVTQTHDEHEGLTHSSRPKYTAVHIHTHTGY